MNSEFAPEPHHTDYWEDDEDPEFENMGELNDDELEEGSGDSESSS